MLNTSTGANKTSSLTGEAWRIQKGMLEGQKTMNSIPPQERQGAHYTQRENKSQRYVLRGKGIGNTCRYRYYEYIWLTNQQDWQLLSDQGDIWR
jgi:hypothetical protein